MIVYPDPSALARAIGCPLESGETPSFASESDWGYALRGAGCEGGMGRSRWLLTFATAEPDAQVGHLVAWHVNASNQRTGRCALLRSPWDRDQDWAELRRVMGTPAWNPASSIGEADIVELDELLVGQRLA